MWLEFILVPFATIVVFGLSLDRGQADYAPAAKLLNFLAIAIGIFLIVYTFYRIADDYTEFFSVRTLRDLYTPPLLSLITLPVLFGLFVYFTLERWIRQLNFAVRDSGLRRRARWLALWSFGFSLRGLKRWSLHLARHQPESMDAILTSIHMVKAAIKRDRAPPTVPIAEGWSLAQAKNFLTDSGLHVGDYDHHPYIRWNASSQSLKFGDDALAPKISFSIEGTQNAVRRLCVNLYAFNRNDNSEAADAAFWVISVVLLAKATGAQMAVESGFEKFPIDALEYTSGLFRIKIFCDEHDKRTGGYERDMTIEHLIDGKEFQVFSSA